MSENTQEPTMEEILASIRRIISEDEATAAGETPAAVEAAAAPPPSENEPKHQPEHEPEPEEEEEEPLMLEEQAPAPPAPQPEPVHQPQAAMVDDLDFMVTPPPAPPPPPPVAHAPLPEPEPVPMHEPLVSAPAADSVASAFGALERSIMMPPGERSLEDVIREMLRPMLKAWLDENLPPIVHAQVAAEVERIARQRR